MPANKRSQAWDTGLNLATSSAGDPLWQWLSLSGHCPAPLHPQGSAWTEHIHVSPPLCRAVGPLQELFAQDNERGQHPVGLQRARWAQGALHPEKPRWRQTFLTLPVDHHHHKNCSWLLQIFSFLYLFHICLSVIFMTEPSLFSPPRCKTSVQCSGDAEGDRDLIYLLQ